MVVVSKKMDKADTRNQLPSQTNKVLDLVQQLREYEQNTVEHMNQLINAFKTKKHDVKDNVKKLHTSVAALSNQYQQIEIRDFYKSKICNEITDLRTIIEETNQRIYETNKLLQDIDSSSVTAKDIVRKKQARLEQDKNLLKKEIVSLEQYLQKLHLEHQQFLCDVDIEKIKSQTDENESAIKVFETDIATILSKDSDLENQLKLNESNISDKEKYIAELNLEILGLTDNSCYEEKILELQTTLSAGQLEVEKWNLSEINLRNKLPEIANDILLANEETVKLETHEVYQLLKEEEQIYENEANRLAVQIDGMKANISGLENDEIEEKTKADNLKQEFATLEVIINDEQKKILELNEQIDNCKNEDISSLVQNCRDETKSTVDQIFVRNTEIAQLQTSLKDLELKIQSAPSVTDKDIQALKLEKDNLLKETDANLNQMEVDFQAFLKEHEQLKKDNQEDMANKIANIQELVKETTTKIEKAAQAERNEDMLLQGNMVECDIFDRKLKLAEQARDNLKMQIANIQNPPPQIARKKRSVEELSESSFTGLMSVKDCIKYKIAKERKMARRK